MAAGFGPAKEPKRRVKMDEMVGGLLSKGEEAESLFIGYLGRGTGR
jgi:hypothetical protein